MENSIRKLFQRYERFFKQALDGDIDQDEIAALYSSEFIAASPGGVVTGKNDDEFKQFMVRGYARYRAIGTREMRIRGIRLSPIDELHTVAHVDWTAIYGSESQEADVSIDFTVHYFVQTLEGQSRVFGWVAGDEQALLKEYGIGESKMNVNP